MYAQFTPVAGCSVTRGAVAWAKFTRAAARTAKGFPAVPWPVHWPCRVLAVCGWTGQLDAHGPEQPRGAAQHREPGIRHGEESLDGQLEVRPQARIFAQPGDRPPVSPE